MEPTDLAELTMTAITAVMIAMRFRPRTLRFSVDGIRVRRRGWTADSLKVGDMVTIEGWPSRDGSHYLRVRRVVRSDGTVLGAPANQRAD